MQTHAIRSIEIAAPYHDVFAFIADRNNLPHWAHAFESVDPTHARMRTPAGNVDVALDVRASAECGTIDWVMRFPDDSGAAAYSRVTPAGDSHVVYSFVLNAPPAPLERLEGTLTQQLETLQSELVRLKELLEVDGHSR